MKCSTQRITRFQFCKLSLTFTLDYLPYSWGYFLITLTVGVVFLIPGFQVVLEELEKMELTGDRDLCYYNEACQRPSGGTQKYFVN